MALIKVQVAAGNTRVIDIQSAADVQNAIQAALAGFVAPTTTTSRNNAAAPLVANPTASVGLAVVDGSAITAMRSDAAPPLSQAISPTWTGTHAFSNMITVTGQDVVLVTRQVDTDGVSLTGGGALSADLTLSIDTSWAGQTAITTLGTITTGVWDGTTIAIAHGGTGQTSASAAFNALSPLTTAGDTLYGGVSGAGTRLALGASGDFYTAGSSAPQWITKAAAITSLLPAQTSADADYFLQTDGAGNLSWATGGGSGSPGGSDKSVQYNDSSAFGGDSNFTWDYTNQELVITGKAGKVPLTVNGASGSFSAEIFNTTATAGDSDGLYMQAGTNSSDYCIYLANHDDSKQFFALQGDGSGFLGTSASAGMQWTSGGAFNIAEPASGVALTVNEVAGSDGLLVYAPSGSATDRALNVVYPGQYNLINCFNDGHFVLGWGGAANTITGSAGGAVSIATPTSGIALTVNGIAANWTAQIESSGTSGSGYGLLVTAGSNSSDYSFYVQPHAGGGAYQLIRGDGAASFGDSTALAAVITGVTLNVLTSSGAAIQSTTTVARGSGSNYFQFNDPSGAKGYFGYGSGSTDIFYNYQALNAAIYWYTDGTYAGEFDTSQNFTAVGNVTAYSDARLKTDLKQITHALDKVDQLTGYTFTRTDTKSKPRQTGLIAQDVALVLPEAVTKSHDGMLSLAYGNLMGLMVEAIKELRAEVAMLRAR